MDDSQKALSQNSEVKQKGRKRKKEFKVEKLGQNEEYDDSLLKRRKKKLQGKGITLAVPKKALTAYAIFVKQKRRELQDCPDFNVKSPDMMKQLGKIWSNLTREERKTYEDVAKKDKERYEREMNLLIVNGRTLEKVHEVEHKRPKKCLSAYMIFVRDRRCKISQANPDMPVLQIMKEVGNQWQNLDPKEKQIYQGMADEDKIRYKEELKEFEKEVEKLQITKPPKGKTNNRGKKKTNEVKQSITISETIDTNKTKDPPIESEVIDIEDHSKINLQQEEKQQVSTPINEDFSHIFCKEYSQIFRRSFDNLNNIDVMTKASDKWNKLSPPDKIFYQKSPHLIKNLVMKDITKLHEEAKTSRAPSSQPQNTFKDDTLIKRPMNIWKQEPAVTLSKMPNNPIPREPMRYQMRSTDSNMHAPTNEQEGVMLAKGYCMSDDYNNMSYNRIFPEGRSPPILDQRKRNRRLSSIVGVKSNPYGREFDYEEVLDSRNYEYTKPESRSASIDYNMQYDYPQDPQYADPNKRNGGYCLPTNVANPSMVERQFNQSGVFSSNPEHRSGYGRK